jgi:hypothetical protein
MNKRYWATIEFGSAGVTTDGKMLLSCTSVIQISLIEPEMNIFPSIFDVENILPRT